LAPAGAFPAQRHFVDVALNGDVAWTIEFDLRLQPVGVENLVSGFRARNKSATAVGVNVTFADGRTLFLQGSAPGADCPSDK